MIKRSWSRVPVAVRWVTALWGTLLVGASLVWPMTYGYDEVAHVDMAYEYSAHPLHFYGPMTLSYSDTIVNVQRLLPGHPLKQPLGAVSYAPRGQRPTFSQLGGPGHSGIGLDQMVQHPPLYYELEALVLRIPGVSHLPWDTEIWLMRLLSIVMMLPVPLLAWAATRRLLLAGLVRDELSADRLSLVAAAFPLTLPNLIRDGSSVTNDALLIGVTSVIAWLICRVVTGDLRTRTGVALGVSLLIALLTKGFALALPPVILGAYLIGRLRVGDAPAPWRALVRPLLAAGVGGVLGGLWWLRNLVDYGVLQPAGGMPAPTTPSDGSLLAHVYAFVPRFTTDFVSRIWGGIGYADLPAITPIVTFGFAMLVLIGMLIAPAAGQARRNRLALWFLVAAPLLSFAVAASGSWSTFRHNSVHSVPTASQGRYVYHVVVLVAALATYGWTRVLRPRVTALAAPLALAAALVLNAAAWTMIVRSWYDSGRVEGTAAKTWHDLRRLLYVAPLPAWLTVLLVVVAPIAVAVPTARAVCGQARELRRAAVDAEPAQGQLPAAVG